MIHSPVLTLVASYPFANFSLAYSNIFHHHFVLLLFYFVNIFGCSLVAKAYVKQKAWDTQNLGKETAGRFFEPLSQMAGLHVLVYI